jgi:hypothetical protein
MDSNEWSTINAGRDQALGREMDQLRRRYREHLETLTRLAQSAPTEQLARRYEELKLEINAAIDRLGELERGTASQRSTAPITAATAAGVAAVPAASVPPPPPPPRSWDAMPAQPGTEPYVPATSDRTGIRAIAIVAIGAVVLAILGVIAWRTMSHRGSGKVVEEPTAVTTEQPKIIPSDTTGTVVTPGGVASAGVADTLSVKPQSQDYGTVRKGTRVVKKFELTNGTGDPMTIVVSRSVCHCLWFDYQAKLAAGAKTPLSVSLDGGRAKKGPVNETVTVSSKEHPDDKVSFTLTANVD